MKTYALTSTKFTGAVIFEFNTEGFLVRYDTIGAQLSDEQTTFILQKLPKNIDAIQRVLGTSRDAKLALQKAANVTFDQFWNRYDEKAVSSKKKAAQRWLRMSQVQRDLAYNFIDSYVRSIPTGIAKKYAETYLNAELWNN